MTTESALQRADELEAQGLVREASDLLLDFNSADRSLDLDRRILQLRHKAGAMLVGGSAPGAGHPRPAFRKFRKTEGVPEITPDELTPAVLRAAIVRKGGLLVRGLMDPDEALEIAAGIDRSFEARTAAGENTPDARGEYEEFIPVEPYGIAERPWIAKGGGVLAVDAPRLMVDLLEFFERSGLREVVEGYLGEPPVVSAQKSTLRKAESSVGGAWHQDGKFLGDVNAMNVWVALSHCGDTAPGLDVIPKRFDDFVENGTRDTKLANQVPQSVAEEVAEGVGIFRPIFEPGDVMLFDEMYLHQTASEPSMPNPRYAIESWFFGPSAYPAGYVPIAA